MIKMFKLMLSLMLAALSLSLTFAATGDSTTGSNSTGSDSSIEDDLESLEGDFGDLDSLEEDSNTGDSETTGDSKTSTGDEEFMLNWGFSSGDTISVVETTTGSVAFTGPVVEDGNGEVIKNYKILYSTEPMEEVDPLKMSEKSFVFDSLTGDSFKMNIDKLDPNTTYYGIVLPLNKDEIEGESSDEIEFTTKEIPKPEPEEKHNAAPVNMKDFSYNYSGNTVELKWTPVEGSEKVEIFLRKSNEKDFSKLGEEDMSKGTYSFKVEDEGKYFAKVIPTDDSMNPVGNETIQSIEVDNVEKEEMKKSPAVGPTTNMIVGLMILAVVAYVVYRFRRV